MLPHDFRNCALGGVAYLGFLVRTNFCWYPHHLLSHRLSGLESSIVLPQEVLGVVGSPRWPAEPLMYTTDLGVVHSLSSPCSSSLGVGEMGAEVFSNTSGVSYSPVRTKPCGTDPVCSSPHPKRLFLACLHGLSWKMIGENRVSYLVTAFLEVFQDSRDSCPLFCVVLLSC